ncbi:uncharacterized protein LOC106766301 [Vigna radiata var. radiata]|uniref:Uncharacterized protein LOC106766301 n=1 Tax=Vigna radiata var. radiata TaxID=3916 RepID=A0A1S3UKF8_VIGRR|nr:uncharacterized protein LOC106766301 [Vigna radiata var. radiata]
MTSKKACNLWIVDSGAFNHMTGMIDNLRESRALQGCPVGLPNSEPMMDHILRTLIGAGERKDGLYWFHGVTDIKAYQINTENCEKKVDACKQKIEEARSETVADAELDLLQRELEEELEKECLLKEEFRAIGDEFNDLEQQWISVQEQKKTLQKIEKTKLRAQT